MAKKLQSFYIRKFQSSRLRDSNYNLHITIDEARRNGELVRSGDSELFRALRRITNKEFSQEELDKILLEKKKLQRKTNSSTIRKLLLLLEKQIDDILYIEEIIAIKFDDVRHYQKIIKQGIKINGFYYKRLLCGAGHSRRSTVFFVRTDIVEQLSAFLICGHKGNLQINPNKYNAYYALASSATLPVSKCNFAVIPDKEVTRRIKVDHMIEIDKNTDPSFLEHEIKAKFNLWDGQGLVSYGQAQIWAEELELDYVPACFVWRGAFSKGLLVTFDFHNFAQEQGATKIVDIYGTNHHVDDLEIILSASQFKLASGYNNIEEYNTACKEHGFGWGISRVSPKEEKNKTQTTYQYLQVLNIDNDDKIRDLCSDTISWLNDISGAGWEESVLFSLGEIEEDMVSVEWVNNIQNNVVKALLVEPYAIKDAHVKKFLLRTISKKIKESKIGVLNIDGNYQFVIADPYAQAQHALGLEISGILQDGEFYSQYWNNKSIKKVSCFRSPCTWRSEPLVLDLISTDETARWFPHLYSGIVLNIHGDTLMKLSGGDVDGDIIMTTPLFINDVYTQYHTPYYERKAAPKKHLDETDLWLADTTSFGGHIGLVTNYATTYLAMLKLYAEDSEEYKQIINRLKMCNCLQSMSIDAAKGVEVFDVPEWWSKWSKIEEWMGKYEAETLLLNNRLLCKQRPYFMRYVYPTSYGKRYKKHVEIHESLSRTRLDKSLQEIFDSENRNVLEQEIVDSFEKYNPLLDSPSIMNKICHHIEQSVRDIKETTIGFSDFDYTIYQDKSILLREEALHEMRLLFLEFNAHRKSKREWQEAGSSTGGISGETEEQNISDEYWKIIKRKAYKISSNANELASLAVEVCYANGRKGSKEFAWRLFGKEICDILLDKSMGIISVPVLDESGSIEYMGKKHILKTFSLADREEEL